MENKENTNEMSKEAVSVATGAITAVCFTSAGDFAGATPFEEGIAVYLASEAWDTVTGWFGW